MAEDTGNSGGMHRGLVAVLATALTLLVTLGLNIRIDRAIRDAINAAKAERVDQVEEEQRSIKQMIRCIWRAEEMPFRENCEDTPIDE